MDAIILILAALAWTVFVYVLKDLTSFPSNLAFGFLLAGLAAMVMFKPKLLREDDEDKWWPLEIAMMAFFALAFIYL